MTPALRAGADGRRAAPNRHGRDAAPTGQHHHGRPLPHNAIQPANLRPMSLSCRARARQTGYRPPATPSFAGAISLVAVRKSSSGRAPSPVSRSVSVNQQFFGRSSGAAPGARHCQVTRSKPLCGHRNAFWMPDSVVIGCSRRRLLGWCRTVRAPRMTLAHSSARRWLLPRDRWQSPASPALAISEPLRSFAATLPAMRRVGQWTPSGIAPSVGWVSRRWISAGIVMTVRTAHTG